VIFCGGFCLHRNLRTSALICGLDFFAFASIRVHSRLAFNRTGGHALDEAALQEKEESHGWSNDNDRSGHNLSPIAAVLATESIEPDYSGLLIMALQEG
jgi:hypothetical protein